MSTAGYVALADRGVLALRGVDARPFLQGLISNDVEQVRSDQALYGALLTPQGKFLFDFFIAQHGDSLLLETELARLADLQRRLMMYRLRSKVDIEDASAGFTVAALIGEGVAGLLGLPPRPGACRALDLGLAFVDPRLAAMGVRALLPAPDVASTLTDLGLEAVPPAAYERLRLSLGVPDGSRDLVIDRSLLLESGFEELNGVSFTKGCFVGQELTARTKHRGLIKKRLMPVRIHGPLPAAGTIVRRGEREAGEMRSAIAGENGLDGLGLALLRLEQLTPLAAASGPLRAGDATLTPAPPLWLELTAQD
jgi:folate-binding protein YgfZ